MALVQVRTQNQSLRAWDVSCLAPGWLLTCIGLWANSPVSPQGTGAQASAQQLYMGFFGETEHEPGRSWWPLEELA